jgi:hypothetical protein
MRDEVQKRAGSRSKREVGRKYPTPFEATLISLILSFFLNLERDVPVVAARARKSLSSLTSRKRSRRRRAQIS